MDRSEILSSLTQVFRDVLDEDDIELNEETTADDLEDWDSLSHVQIILSVEEAFGISIGASEVAGLKNVGEFLLLIESKQ